MDDELLCVGMTDGTLSMQKRKEAVDDELLEQKRLVKRHFNKYLLKEKVYQPEEVRISEQLNYSGISQTPAWVDY